MNHLANITKKELRELLTPSSIASIVVVVVLLMSMGTLIGGEMDEVTSASTIGIVNGDDGEYSKLAIDYIYDYYDQSYGLDREAASEYIIPLESDISDNLAILNEMKDKGIGTAIGISETFSTDISSGQKGTMSDYYLYESSGILGAATSSVTNAIISYVSSGISYNLLKGMVPAGSDMSFLLYPVSYSGDNTYTYINGNVYTNITPTEISSAMTSQSMLIPIIIMIIIVMIGSIVISSMGNEKENKTLETLLTMPVKRTTIVAGKLIAAAITGLVFGLAYLVGMMTYMNGLMSGTGDVDLAEYGLSLGATDWVIILVMIFLAILCALGLCMILGAFVKNYKAAQTMTLPIGVIAMIPMFVTMFSSWDALPGFMQGILFAIPFTHPMMIMDNLMFDNTLLVYSGLVYLVLFTIATIYITVRIYKSDILITGISATKYAKYFQKKVKHEKEDH